MAALKSITIIGGGLAGLTLGIGLRQRDVPVVIHEAGSYPRHRVCGEFISGRGQATLARLGLNSLLENAGAVPARTAAFFTTTKSAPPRPLPSAAICLSRFALDQLLAEEFQRLGGDLRLNERRPSVGIRASDCLDTPDHGLRPEGVVRATGRRVQAEQGSEPWFGLKIHARNVPLAADLEMHVSPQGYVGLCRINNGLVNVCGIFRRRTGGSFSGPAARERLLGQPGSPLRERLAVAEFDESSLCAVAGISLRPQRAVERHEICIGDAITMIPPVTGNGMSMAFESAELAIEPVSEWSRDEISWIAAHEKITRDCDAAFARRLLWAKWLQRLILTPALQNPLIALASRSEWFWRMAFEYTR